MDEQINSVVNNLAGKIGIAAEKLQPIAETVVQETGTRGMVLGLTFLLATVSALFLSIFFSVKLFKHEQKSRDQELLWPIPMLAGGIVSIFCFIGCVVWAMDWLAPTRSVLEEVLKH